MIGYVFLPMDLIYSTIMLWNLMGWSVLSGFILYGISWFVNLQIDAYISYNEN